MQANGYKICVPQNDDPSVKPEPWLNLNSGYILRAADKLPKQGSKTPWKLHQNYVKDVLSLKFGALDDGVIRFLNPADSLAAAVRVVELTGAACRRRVPAPRIGRLLLRDFPGPGDRLTARLPFRAQRPGTDGILGIK